MSARPGILENALARDPTTTLADTEEARAFFQSRLATFALATLLLSGTPWLSLAVAQLVAGGDPSADHAPFSTGGTLHFVGVLGAGALWLVTRRRALVSPVLHAIDIGGTLAIIGMFAAAGGVLAPQVGTFVALLAFLMGTLTRAVVVPSTARRSLFIGLVIAVEVMAFAVWRNQSSGAAAIQAVVATACWGVAGVAIGTFASHTIFGLRRQVRRAHVLGQYRLEAKIGEGGMGEVWRASHALLCRPTAVKLLPPERTGEEAIRRFEREVQMTARLTHPGTVAIYDYGRTRDGIFYYAMELLDGTDLESLVRQYGPQPPGRVVHILRADLRRPGRGTRPRARPSRCQAGQHSAFAAQRRARVRQDPRLRPGQGDAQRAPAGAGALGGQHHHRDAALHLAGGDPRAENLSTDRAISTRSVRWPGFFWSAALRSKARTWWRCAASISRPPLCAHPPPSVGRFPRTWRKRCSPASRSVRRLVPPVHARCADFWSARAPQGSGAREMRRPGGKSGRRREWPASKTGSPARSSPTLTLGRRRPMGRRARPRSADVRLADGVALRITRARRECVPVFQRSRPVASGSGSDETRPPRRR